MSDIQARLIFARRCLRQKLSWFDKLIFTDEKWFDCNDSGHRHQWCEREKWKSTLAGRQHTQSGPSVFVWGAISLYFRIIVFVEYEGKGMNQHHYIDQCLRAIRRKSCANLILQQDGAKIHWTPLVRSHLKEMRLAPLENWPPHSPDMNPIEHLWSRLQRAVSERGPFGVEELKQYVEEEFNKVPDDDIRKLVLSYRKRCQEVAASCGHVHL